MDLSLVIPCFDEAERIDGCLRETLAWVDGLGIEAEVLVVDDGSRDGTADRVRAWAARRPEVRLLSLPRNRGKGAAVREGVLAATGDVVAFLDADLAVHPSAVGPMLPALENGVDVAVGSRATRGARVERPQRALRRWLGRGYLALARTLLRVPVSDVTCGLKGFRREVARALFADARCRRWGFDAEVLHLAARKNYVVAEFPVSWRDGDGTRVRVPRDAARSLGELLGVRWRSLRGAYGPRLPEGERGPR